MSEEAPATLRVRVSEAQAWAAWLRAVRAEIAELKERGEVHPELAAPQHAYEGLLELLAAIDALPGDAEHADVCLPGPERLSGLAAQLAHVRPMFDHWLQWRLLATDRPEEAERFERQLLRHARGTAAHHR